MTQINDWWTARRVLFENRARRLLAAPRWRVMQPFAFMDDDEIPGVDLVHILDKQNWDRSPEPAHIYFSKGYQSDIPRIWNVMRQHKVLMTGCWFWDNHHLFASTMHAAMLTDIGFFAHDWASHYARNELSLFGGYAALCPIFYKRSDVRRQMPFQLERTRSDALFGWYNSYAEWPERDALIDAVRASGSPSNLVTFKHGIPWMEHPFYGLPHEQKYAHWGEHKVTLCLSFGRNMSMRIFDALLAGQIPIVAGEVADLDRTIDRATQEALPLIRTSTDPGEIWAAHRAARDRFDAEGAAGIARRIEHVLANHMPANRIAHMLGELRRQLEARFGGGASA